ncbi:MAG: LytTR family transcriptional regulator DNA-binding domain-containing protein [Faecalibacillus faecis]
MITSDFIERKNLSSFIKEIDSNSFIQIHKSFVINKNFIKEIKAKN